MLNSGPCAHLLNDTRFDNPTISQTAQETMIVSRISKKTTSVSQKQNIMAAELEKEKRADNNIITDRCTEF